MLGKRYDAGVMCAFFGHPFARLVAVCALLWCSVGTARADRALDDERARTHFIAGESHFAAERWGDAAREFTLAYELSKRPEMLVNLSRAHERGDQLEAAIADLDRLLAAFPDTPYRLEAQQRITAMQTRLAAEHEAEIARQKTEAARPLARDATTRAWWPPRAPTLAVGAVALAAGAAALGTGLRGHKLYRDLEARCPGARCPASFEEDRDRGRALTRASTGLSFALLGLAGATAVLWVYDVKPRKERRLSLSLTASLSEASLRGRF